MQVKMRKAVMDLAKGQIVDLPEEKAKHYINIRYAEPYKPVAALLDDLTIPPRRTKEAKELLNRITKHYENKADFNLGHEG